MHYLFTLLIIAVGCFCLGFFGRAINRRAQPWQMAILGALLGAGAVWLSNAYAVPADIETATAYNLGTDPSPAQVKQYARPCSRGKFSDALRGDFRPLPIDCVLPLPLEEATVSKPSTDYHYVKPARMFKGIE